MDWTEQQIPPPSWHRECPLDLPADPDVALTTIVRQYYLRHLANAVEENYRIYFTVHPERLADLHSCVLHLERRALRACMVSDIYRRTMLNVIHDIKSHTSLNKLQTDVLNVMEQLKTCIPGSVGPFLTPPADFPSQLTKEQSTMEVQTDCITVCENNGSLTQDVFPTVSTFSSSGAEIIHPLPYYGCSGNTSPHSPEENKAEPEINIDWDQIEEDMARVCGEIFFSGAMNGEAHLNEEMSLKLNFTRGEQLNHHKVSESQLQEIASVSQLNEVQPTYWKQLRIFHEKELEQYLERLRKNTALQKFARVKKLLKALFGPDELIRNQVQALTRQERLPYHERIAPWVVKHLMPLYKRGKITSKTNFKKAAKHISGSLMRNHLFPDECDVWMAVQEFTHKRIINMEDLAL